MGYYLQRLTRAAVWRGIHEGSRRWLFLGLALALALARAAHRAVSEPEARAVVDVRAGDALEVRVVDPPR